jgi:hypothetical protein
MPTQRRPKRLVAKPRTRISSETLALFRELKRRYANGDYGDFGDDIRERRKEFIDLMNELDRPFDTGLTMGIFWYFRKPNYPPRPDDPEEILAHDMARLLEQADRDTPE